MSEGVEAAERRAGAERGDDGFLSRWSRRKTQARHGQVPAAEAPTDGPMRQRLEPGSPDGDPMQPAAASAAEPTTVAEPPLTDADMPPLESLGPDSDYSGFLSPGVSKELRRQALARLFRGAAFNVTDGLDDYAEDFTQFTPLGDLVTADMRHRVERELEQQAQDRTDTAPDVADHPPEQSLDQSPGQRPEQIPEERLQERIDGADSPASAASAPNPPADRPAEARDPNHDAEPELDAADQPAGARTA